MNQDYIRSLTKEMLEEELAHAGFERATENIPLEYVNKRTRKLPYTIFELSEHIRIAQWDIVEYSINSSHQSPKWPEEYWPSKQVSVNEEEWNTCLDKIKKDRLRLLKLIRNPDTDFIKPYDNGSGHTLLREILLLLQHTSYHTGQIVLIRKILNIW